MAQATTHGATTAAAPVASEPWYKVLYIQVLIAIALGVAVGYFYPDFGKSLKWLGDAFVALIKMMIAPIIFCTIVAGIASVGDLKKVGRVGLKALIYFELVTTLAMLIGLAVVHVAKPGVGVNYQPSAAEVQKAQTYDQEGKKQNAKDFILHIIP